MTNTERPRLDNKLYIRLRGGTYREATPEEVMTGGWVKDPTYRRSAIMSQDQRSVTDQLNDLYRIAINHGLYDAADFMAMQARGTARKQAESRVYDHE